MTNKPDRQRRLTGTATNPLRVYFISRFAGTIPRCSSFNLRILERRTQASNEHEKTAPYSLLPPLFPARCRPSGRGSPVALSSATHELSPFYWASWLALVSRSYIFSNLAFAFVSWHWQLSFRGRPPTQNPERRKQEPPSTP